MLKPNPLALAAITLLYAVTACASAMLQPLRVVVGLDAVGAASSYFTSMASASRVVAEHPEALWVTCAVYLPATVAIYS